MFLSAFRLRLFSRSRDRSGKHFRRVWTRQTRAILRQMSAVQSHTTEQLIRRIRVGDAQAREELCARCLPLLRRWAHGRLPHYARDLNDTGDLIQITLMRALNQLDRFESQRQGSFLAHVRTVLLNAVRDEIRRASRSRGVDTWHESVPDTRAPSPVELAVGQQELARYEAALDRLSGSEREVMILRIEFGLSFPEIAEETGSTKDAVRMVYNRTRPKLEALLQLPPIHEHAGNPAGAA